MNQFKAFDKMARGEQAVWVFFGDSITEQNYHLHDHLNYVGLLCDPLWFKFGGGKYIMINAGVSGNTTRHLLARVEQDVLRFEPDLVSIMVGINDCAKQIPPEEFHTNLIDLIQRIQDRNCEVLLLTPHPLLTTSEPFHLYPQYIEAIRDVSCERNVQLIDIYQDWQLLLSEEPNRHYSLMDDQLHPNERGHRKIADLLIEKLTLHR